MNKPSLLIAAGCSWVAGRAIDTDPTSEEYDYSRREDPEFVKEHSFAGRLCRLLNLDDIHFLAKSGSNNDEQLEALIPYVAQTRNIYGKIFVIWGLTSIYRWNMYSTSQGRVVDCAFGRPTKPELEKEIKQYFSNYWNAEYALKKLGNAVVLLDGYLTSQGIDHVFFNAFNGYTDNDLQILGIEDKHFYKVREKDNDMLSLLYAKNNIDPDRSKGPWLNLSQKDRQFHNESVRQLQNLGWLDKATAHPTVMAHEYIAQKLHEYILRERTK